VTLGRQFQFGVDWSLFEAHLRIGSIGNRTGEVAPTFPGLSITYLNDNIEAAVRALGAKTDIQVVSAPKIISLDNRTARLQVGDQVPIVTQSAQSTVTPDASLVSSIDYRSTGVILTVTPRISGGDRVVLDVSQEVSSVAQTNSSGIDSPTIQQRRFESSLVLQDGQTVALGGLISSNRSNSNSGVPGLKDVPVLGALFRSEGRDHSRSELIILLSARIISDAASANRVMEELATDMQELQRRGLLPTKKP
jgi:general secretion pathway protein D